jgi:hypothetical protein
MNGIVFFVFQSELQENLIRSHAAGVGRALTPQKTRMLLALRINVLAKGYSGISLTTLQQLIDAFNCKLLFELLNSIFADRIQISKKIPISLRCSIHMFTLVALTYLFKI